MIKWLNDFLWCNSTITSDIKPAPKPCFLILLPGTVPVTFPLALFPGPVPRHCFSALFLSLFPRPVPLHCLYGLLSQTSLFSHYPSLPGSSASGGFRPENPPKGVLPHRLVPRRPPGTAAAEQGNIIRPTWCPKFPISCCPWWSLLVKHIANY